jgi:hypothetical protein
MPVNCFECGNFNNCDELKSFSMPECNEFIQAVTKLNSVELAELRDNEENLHDRIQRYIKKDNTHRDFIVDDSDLKEYPNYYKFILSPHGANSNPFSRQLLIGIYLFGEYCPRCSHPMFDGRDVTVVPVDMPAKEVVEKMQLLRFGVCPKCKVKKEELYRSGELLFRNEFVGDIGQRAGKNITAVDLSSYIVHKYIKMGNPVRRLNLSSDTTISAVFTSITEKRALKNLWKPMHNKLTKSPWFTEYNKLLKYYGDKHSTEYLRIKDTYISYEHKNMYLYVSSPSKRKLRGDTGFLAVPDELGWFPYGDDEEHREQANANEVYEALENSLVTVRSSSRDLLYKGQNSLLTGYMLNISSPSNARDKISTLYTDSLHNDSMLGVNLPTWEINPNLPKDHKDIRNKYRKNHVKAERDFGANPPHNSYPLFGGYNYIDHVFKGKIRLKYKYKTQRSRGGTGVYIEYLGMPKIHYPLIMGLDAGHTNNSFAFSLGYIKDDGFYMPAFAEVIPDGNKINHALLYENFIYPLIDSQDVRVVVADRWQHIKLFDDIDMDFENVLLTKPYSLKYNDLVMVHDYLVDKNYKIRFPRLEDDYNPKDIFNLDISNYPKCFKNTPMQHLLYQMLTVEDHKNKVIKGDGLTDDIFRAMAIALYSMINDEDVQYILTQESDTPTQNTNNPVFGVRGAGGSVINSNLDIKHHQLAHKENLIGVRG